MSIRSKLHFWRITLRRRAILLGLMFCGNGGYRAKYLKKAGVFLVVSVRIAGMNRISYQASRNWFGWETMSILQPMYQYSTMIS